MTICACLVWYDETIASLERCVSSLAGLTDVLVAVDGRWKLMPGDTTYSPVEQHDAIAAAAEKAGIQCQLYEAPPWALKTQVAKRDYAMALASAAADWVLVIDGDEYVERCDAAAVHQALEQTDRDVHEISIRNSGRRIFHVAAAARRRGYRSRACAALGVAHNGYRTADGKWLNGDSAHVDLEPALDLSGAVAVVHDRDARPCERQKRSDFYYRVRAALGEEAWVA